MDLTEYVVLWWYASDVGERAYADEASAQAKAKALVAEGWLDNGPISVVKRRTWLHQKLETIGFAANAGNIMSRREGVLA